MPRLDGRGPQELSELIAAVRDALVARDRSVAGLQPGATPSAIERFETSHRLTFPPSYRLFLTQHNGWEDYVDGFSLIGIDGEHTERALADIALTVDSFLDAWTLTNGEPSPEKVREYEARGDLTNPLEASRQPFVPDKVPFATNFNGAIRFFDPGHLDEAGEMEVWCWSTSAGSFCRHPTFLHMLRADLDVLSRRETD